jgi:hypothetical protein
MLVTALTGSRCLPLLQVVADDMVGYLIASDIEDVAAVQYEEEGAFMAWLASRPEGERFGYKWVQHWVLCVQCMQGTRCMACTIQCAPWIRVGALLGALHATGHALGPVACDVQGN